MAKGGNRARTGRVRRIGRALGRAGRGLAARVGGIAGAFGLRPRPARR